MAKNKYTPEQLFDSCETTTEITCTKCRANVYTCGDENLACDDFFNKGWRATSNNTYCPACSKKHLKQTK